MTEEKIVEYIKTNSYQTKLTEELRSSLSKEVWGDLCEFIESVQFINWLIQPEEVRGYAKDRPRDKDGKIIVDLTKPHILEDMDYFRERALFFEKHGKYTHLRPNPNPRSEYSKFWKEELIKWRDGVIRPSDGEWIPGGFYFYLNYSPIWINVEAEKKSNSKKVKGIRKRHFPNAWLGDYLFFHYLDQAKENGAHAKMLKTRGVGASYKLASLSPRNMYIEPGLPNFHLASDKSFLDGEKGVYGKVIDCLDWIGDSTPLPRMRLVNSPRSREIQLGYQDGDTRKGLKSSVYGISLKDNPDKARGIRGPLIHYEEDGLFPDLEKAWSVNRKAVEDGDVVYGQMVALGCLTKNNKVWDNNGNLISIKDLNPENGILGYDCKSGLVSKEKITYWQPPANKECVRIETNTGRFIECSYDHPILWSTQKFGVTTEGTRIDGIRDRKFKKNAIFKEAELIKIGDQIATINEVPISSNKELFNPRLIGWLIGDGSYGINKTPILSNCEPEINNYLHNILQNEVVTEKTYVTKLGKIYEENRIKGLCGELRSIGIYGQTKNKKTLPIDIHSYSYNSITELLGGFFDTDGYITKNGVISLSCAYKNILLEVQLLLQRLGIHGNILFVKPDLSNPKSKNGHFNLEIKDKDSVLNFVKHIKLYPQEKQDRLNTFNNYYLNKKSRNSNNLSGIRFERVVKIENIGLQPVYNLTAGTTHTYIGNGIITHNTGGTKGADFEGSEKLFRNPLAYNIYGIPNVFDKNTNGETLCGFFWGAYLNRARCYDLVNGEPDVIKALVEILENRFIIKYNASDPSVITQTLAEEPLVPSEAVMRTSGTIFPVSDLKDYRDSVRVQGQRYFDTHYVGDLISTGTNIEWKPNDSLYPIRKFPIGTDKPEGAIEIFEMPKTGSDGKVDNQRYIGGIDPVDDDAAGTTSLTSIFIFDLYTDRIVAEYTGRPKFANDFYEICRRLLIFYNAKANYENNKKGIFNYFDQKRCLTLLCETPQILRDMEYVKGSSYGNKSLGTNATNPINTWGRRLQRDWLMSKAYVQDEDSDGNQIGEKLNMHCTRSIAYVEELIAWNIDINADRVSAMGMLMIYREDRLKYIQNKDKKNSDDDFDEYIDKNFQNAFQGQNSYEKWSVDF